ncbi:MAG: MotE family protein [Bacillus sp. (in: firmicutes)]
MAKHKKNYKVTIGDKRGSGLKWLMFGVLAILFSIFSLVFVLSVSGVNLFSWAKEKGPDIPFVSGIVREEERKADETDLVLIELEAEVLDQSAQIEKLHEEAEEHKKEMQNAAIEKQRLEQQIQELQAVQDEDKKQFKEIIKTYESMTPNKAAAIFSSSEEKDAVKILANLKPDKLADVLEKMEPEKAALFTKRLTVERENNSN